ncbi:MAG: cupin domain-containing protein [Allomuricauda sp.]|nr:MAG: cupin domain-containing protein [Allomuricauda sp.]
MKQTTAMWVLGHKLKPHPTTGDFDMVVFETPAGVPGPPPHLHNNYQEAFLILEGEMEFMINGETRVLKAGESVDIPSGILHTFGNKSASPCKWVNVHSPKGFFDFFKMVGIPEHEEDAIAKSVHPDIIQKVLDHAQDFDMSIPPPVGV